jgi:hypothetical protein
MESRSPAPPASLPPRFEMDPETIRKQLERMLADPLFKHSKRYPNLLRYVVERTLEGAASDLKERTLGIAVFGREPAYDTSSDPIVRTAAGEIRKRIAQYYQEPGREHELRIGLSPGSYIPEFTLPKASGEAAPPAVLVPLRAPRKRTFYWATTAMLTVVLLAAAVWFKPWFHTDALEGFWRPILDSPNNVLVCIGQRRFLGASPESAKDPSPDLESVRQGLDDPNAPISLFRLYYMGSQNIALPDVVTFGYLAGLLSSHKKAYRLRGESATTFYDLRDGPVILVGAFNNDWTMRLMGQLRFTFERDGNTFWIADRQNPSRKNRTVDYSMPYLKLTEDYAVISRALEANTGRMVVMIGGLTGYGTLAAAEFLSNPSFLETAIRQAPPDWRRRNIQFVISTKVINGGSSPPRLVDQYFW